MVVNARKREKIVMWIAEPKGTRNAEIQDRTTATVMIAVQGPKAVELCNGLTEADASQLAYYYAAPTRCLGQQCVISRTGYTGEDGWEFLIGAAHGVAVGEDLIQRGAKPGGPDARES